MSTKQKSFEEAIKELEAIAEKLEKGQLSLEESILAYEKGIELKNLCNTKLKEAETKIETLVKSEKGEVTKTQIKSKMQKEVESDEKDALF